MKTNVAVFVYRSKSSGPDFKFPRPFETELELQRLRAATEALFGPPFRVDVHWGVDLSSESERGFSSFRNGIGGASKDTSPS